MPPQVRKKMSYGDELVSKLLKKQCCACGGIIKDHGKNVNLASVDRVIWEYPTKSDIEGVLQARGNTKEKGRAVAIICDICVETKTPIQYAVQLENDEVVYYPISTLKKI